MLSIRGYAVCTQNEDKLILTLIKSKQHGTVNQTKAVRGQTARSEQARHRTRTLSHHAGLCGEDDDLVQGGELLQQVVDAWTFLKAPTCRQLERAGNTHSEALQQHRDV